MAYLTEVNVDIAAAEAGGLTAVEIEAVRESWARLREISEVASTLFYQTLFELDPALRSLFPVTDLTEQKQKLVATLDFAVASLTRPESFVPVVQELGRRHVAYGVRTAHYTTVGQAMLVAFEKGLGDAWTPLAARAWTKTYGLVASTMIAAAEQRS